MHSLTETLFADTYARNNKLINKEFYQMIFTIEFTFLTCHSSQTLKIFEVSHFSQSIPNLIKKFRDV
jgi:hypothetical protein